MNKRSNCIVCSTPLRGRQTKYCSSRCKLSFLQSYPNQKQRGLSRKLELIRLLSGKCEKCGYCANIAALTFHHNEGEKDFKLDVRSLSNRTYSKVQSEVRKCILLCANCHAEIHNPKLNLASLSIEPTALTTELRAHN